MVWGLARSQCLVLLESSPKLRQGRICKGGEWWAHLRLWTQKDRVCKQGSKRKLIQCKNGWKWKWVYLMVRFAPGNSLPNPGDRLSVLLHCLRLWQLVLRTFPYRAKLAIFEKKNYSWYRERKSCLKICEECELVRYWKLGRDKSRARLRL